MLVSNLSLCVMVLTFIIVFLFLLIAKPSIVLTTDAQGVTKLDVGKLIAHSSAVAVIAGILVIVYGLFENNMYKSSYQIPHYESTLPTFNPNDSFASYGSMPDIVDSYL